MPFSLIPFALLAVPLLEIAVFVVIGGQIGLFATLALVVLTAVAGSILLRAQGFGLIERIRTEVKAGRVPARELVHGVMLLLAGALLLTPGFVTDAAGLVLFVPPFRDTVWAFLRKRTIVFEADGTAQGPDGAGSGRRDGRTIDLDEDDYAPAPDPNTPWGDEPAKRNGRTVSRPD